MKAQPFMSSDAETRSSSRFTQFQDLLAKLASDPAEAKLFTATVNSPETLAAYTAGKGMILDIGEAETVYGALRELAATLPLRDEELAEVAGGVKKISFTSTSVPVLKW